MRMDGGVLVKFGRILAREKRGRERGREVERKEEEEWKKPPLRVGGVKSLNFPILIKS